MPDANKQPARREYTVQCQVCGAEFKTTGSNTKRCQSCSKEFERICYRLRSRNERAEVPNACSKAKDDTLAIMREAVKQRIPFKEAERQFLSSPDVVSEGLPEHPCPYCGKMIASSIEYCTRCTYNGLDNIHRVTGRTNGWDRPALARPRRPVGSRRGYPAIPVSSKRK